MVARAEELQVERFKYHAVRFHEKSAKLLTAGRPLQSSLRKEIARIEDDLTQFLGDEAVQLWIIAGLGLLPDNPQEVEIDPEVLAPDEVIALSWYKEKVLAQSEDKKENGDQSKGVNNPPRKRSVVDRPERKRPFRSKADFIQAQERLLELIQGELEVNPYQMFNTALFAASLARDEYHILRLYRILAKEGHDLPPKINDLDAIDQRVGELTNLGITDEGILDRTGISESRLEASRTRIHRRTKELNEQNISILRKIGMTHREIAYVLNLSKSVVGRSLSNIYERDESLRIRKRSLSKTPSEEE